jgi:phage-related protein
MKFRYDFAKFNRTIPMIDFLDNLSLREKALILKNIEKLIEYKNNNFNVPLRFSKYLEDGIFELKIRLPDKISRILYFYEEQQMIIFTHGFIKKTQKVPRKEIERAKTIKEVYRRDRS